MTDLLDIDQLRRDYSLPSIAAGVIELRRAGREWKACCPFHADRSPSFTIFDGGQRFYCFGCGAHGDVLDFVQRLQGVSLRDAARLLTGGDLPAVEVAALPPSENRETERQVKTIWREAQPITGTLAETYLRSRGLDLNLPPTLRFARLRYGERGRLHPCLIAAISAPDGKLCGIQRTYLRKDGKGKLDVPKPKLSLGRVSGGAIRLAPPSAKLIVTEGLEDGLTLQQELGSAIWVAAGASMLPAMQFPPEVREAVIGGDGDPAGREAAGRAAAEFVRRGLKSRVFFPLAPAKDFNEELIGKRGAA